MITTIPFKSTSWARRFTPPLTGLKVFGEGEWKIRKHGAEKQQVWRKLHLAVGPATHDIVATEMSLENVHDAEVLPTLLNLLRRKLGRVCG